MALLQVQNFAAEREGMELDRIQPRSTSDSTSMHETHPMSMPLPDDPESIPVADLVGWATQRLPEPPLPDEVARGVLATALRVSPASLSGMSADDVQSALRRLRSLIQQIQRLTAEVAVDELTGALRRGTGLDAMRRELARFGRTGGKGVAVVFVDVDHLKELNDTEGHLAGDKLLRETVEAIRERVRAYDIVIRWGGDEFVCVLSDTTEEEARRTVADIEAHVRAHCGGRSVSTGLATYQRGDTPEKLVARADDALYEGRQRVRS